MPGGPSSRLGATASDRLATVRARARAFRTVYAAARRRAGARAALAAVGGKLGRGVWHRVDLAWRAPARIEKVLYARGLWSCRGLPRPDFLGIGVTRAGTTWLYANLRAHPAISMPGKELHYFDRDFARRSLRAYLARFAVAPGQLTGEITPAYCSLPLRRIRLVRAVMPDVRLVLLLRNPIERAWSHALMDLATGTGRDPSEVDPVEFADHFRSPASRARGAYAAILDRWRAVFPADQLYVGLFDDLGARPRALLQEVLAHVGAPPLLGADALPYRDVVNAGPRTALPDRCRALLERLYRPEIEALAERLGDRVAAWGAR
jgi:hypothetical protein